MIYNMPPTEVQALDAILVVLFTPTTCKHGLSMYALIKVFTELEVRHIYTRFIS